MVNFRRNKLGGPGSEYFLTIVTYNRKPRFASSEDWAIVHDALGSIRQRFNLKIIAWAILPDHLHLLLNPNGLDYSAVIYSFKIMVSKSYRQRGAIRNREKFWQDRFWEHTIRDDKDRERCLEYIHYNPVKHKYTDNPRDWEHSSFRNYVERGIYEDSWGEGVDIDVAGAEYD